MLETELFKLLEGTADATFAVDGEGLICSWNRAAQKLFGYAEEEVRRKSCAQLFQGLGALGIPVCGEPCDVLECVAAHREVPNFDLHVKAHSGRRIWLDVSILAFHDERTRHTLAVHLTRDLSRRRHSEELTQKVIGLAKQLVDLPGNGRQPAPVTPLTEQERTVLRLLAEGRRPAEVAQRLHITPRTLRNHIHHANQKLRTRNRLEAVMHALRRGLI
ncbi:MAG: LuxR C-terminal-related transcriptional regulator [Acidobacteriia bacterium]|nr:LuxR C-terminal-related transcriptional regulator [Terriglobia bacterium]